MPSEDRNNLRVDRFIARIKGQPNHLRVDDNCGELIRYKVLKKYPNDACRLYYNSHAYRDLGRFDEAIKSLDAAIELEYNKGLYWYSKGCLLFKLNRVDEALECAKEMIERNPKDGEIWMSRGELLREIGKKEESEVSFKKGKKILSDKN